jgi:hypothetical protein
VLSFENGEELSSMMLQPSYDGDEMGATIVITRQEVERLVEAMVLSYQAKVELLLIVSVHIGDSDSVLSSLLQDTTLNVTLISAPAPAPCPTDEATVDAETNATSVTESEGTEGGEAVEEGDDLMTALLKAVTIEVLSSSASQLTLNITYTGAVPSSAAREESTRTMVHLFQHALSRGGFVQAEIGYGGVKFARATLTSTALSLLHTPSSSNSSTTSDASDNTPQLFAHAVVEFTDPVGLAHLITAVVGTPAKDVCLSVHGLVDWTGAPGGETFNFDVALPIMETSLSDASRRRRATTSTAAAANSGGSGGSGGSSGSSSRRLDSFDFNDYLIGEPVPSLDGLSTTTFLLTVTGST